MTLPTRSCRCVFVKGREKDSDTLFSKAYSCFLDIQKTQNLNLGHSLSEQCS